ATPLTATLIVGPSHADPASLPFVLNPDGTFSYTPAPNFFGTDSFLYFATDSHGLTSGATTVTITVTPVPDAPTAVDDSFSATENLSIFVGAPGTLANDINPEGLPSDMLAFLVSGPSKGSLSLNTDGSFSYTPFANFHGTDSFTYEAYNGALSNTATVTITVLNAVNPPISV